MTVSARPTPKQKGGCHESVFEGKKTQLDLVWVSFEYLSFQDFFALWKDADQNLPILTEAKKDYAALD
jgi:hypothetical protein